MILSDRSQSEILHKALQKSMSYPEFRELVARLAKNNGTTGPEQSDAYKHYTGLNDKRMKRWDKTLRLTEEQIGQIRKFSKKVIWLVITESWCGDAAPTLPVMHRIEQMNDKVDLRIVMRSEEPLLMDQFLTDGKKSIPKLIVIDKEDFKVLGTWGPLPAKASEMAEIYRKKHGSLTAEFKENLQQWFNKDKGEDTLNDLIKLLTLE
jgi:hypothetical protein